VRCFFSVISVKHSDSELQQAMLWAKFLKLIEPAAELRAVVSAKESGKGLVWWCQPPSKSKTWMIKMSKWLEINIIFATANSIPLSII